MSAARCMNPLGRIGKCRSRVTVVNQQLMYIMSELELDTRIGRYICATCRSMLQHRANEFREAEYAHYVTDDNGTDMKINSDYHVKDEIKGAIKMK